MKDTPVLQPQFGHRLREERVRRGLSQRALAGDLVTPSYISLLERGERVPTLDVVVWLAQSLQADLADLLGSGAQGLLGPGANTLERHLSRIETRNLAEAGDLAEAKRTLTARLAAARSSGSHEDVLEYGLGLLPVLAAAAEHAERLALLDELLALPQAGQEPGLLPLRIDRASTLRELGQLTQARDEVARLRELGTARLGEREQVRLLGVMASILVEIGETEAVGPVVTEMLARAEALGQPGTLGRAHWVASIAYARTEQPAGALEQLRAAARLLSFATMPILEWLRFCRSQAAVLLDAGEQAAASRWLDAAEGTAAMTGLESERLAADAERGRYVLAAGDPGRAAEIFGRLADQEHLVGPDLVKVLLGLGEALAQLERGPEAVPVLRRAAGMLEQSGNFRRAAEVWRRIDQLR